MLLDANLLLYATDRSSAAYPVASAWLTQILEGERRVGIPWQSIGAFLRIATHPRVSRSPLTGDDAWAIVENWLGVETVWIPPAGRQTARAYSALSSRVSITGNLVPDAQLAALAIEHGLVVYSADSDFERFPGVRWVNPLRPEAAEVRR